MKIHFILVKPAIPENIGFAARALKTMGFLSLRLVNTQSHLAQGARTTAYGSHDVLSQIKVFPDLTAALKDIDLAIGTTAKRRVKRYNYFIPKQLPGILAKKEGLANNTGIVFGNEENGLTNQDLDRCDIISTIPLATPYPSLNLAQSVLIYAHELSQYARKTASPLSKMPSARQQSELKKKAVELLEWLEVQASPALYQRILDRLMLAGEEDTKLLLSFTRYLYRKKKK